MKFSLSLIAFTIVLSACNSLKSSQQKSTVDSRVNNIVWSITSFKGRASEAKAYIVFNMQDSKINGNDGCNSFMGVAHYTGSSIITGPIASTKMACPGNTIQTGLYDILASKDLLWRLNSDGTLRLFVNDAEVMALKERQ